MVAREGPGNSSGLEEEGGGEHGSPWEENGVEGAGHRLEAKVRVRRPRARAVAPSRGRVAAPLSSLSLHRSLWQHRVVAVPLLTWPGWLYLGVHASTHSFSTRFPDRGSTGDNRHRQAGRSSLNPTPHPLASTAPQVLSPGLYGHHDPTVTNITPRNFPGMVPQPLGHLDRALGWPRTLTPGHGPAVA